MAPRPGYKERYCAFVDILGFGRLVSELAAGNAKYSLLKNLLSTIQSPIHEDRNVFRDTDFRAQSISDAIALSSAPTPQGLWQLLSTLERITLQLLAEGYFVRGAVVRDRLYHDDRMVFGQALVKAYALETQVVKFPRIMLASPVGTYVLNHPKIGPLWRFGFKDRVRAADDGPLFLHVLRRMTSDLQEEMKRKSGVSFVRSPDWKLYARMG